MPPTAVNHGEVAGYDAQFVVIAASVKGASCGMIGIRCAQPAAPESPVAVTMLTPAPAAVAATQSVRCRAAGPAMRSMLPLCTSDSQMP